MPNTHNLAINIDKQPVEIASAQDTGIAISYVLEDPENFEQKQASISIGVEMPATPSNDKIFNHFYDPSVEDLTPGSIYSSPRICEIIVNGITILKGKSLLSSASHSRLPGKYTMNCYGQSGDWLIDGQNITLWDCLSTTPHTFDVATIEASWANFDTDEAHDFVYAPVRYRQPFQYVDPVSGIQQGSDDHCSIYMLRPSISPYWILIRFFRLLGYSINSKFLNTANYFRRMVLPWVWGDFFDINSQLTDGISFKAVGVQTTDVRPTSYTSGIYFTGATAEAAGWTVFQTLYATGTGYIKSGTVLGETSFFQMSNTNPPNGFDNFTLYTFDETTGTMQYTFTPPAPLAALMGTNITINFLISLYIGVVADSGNQCDVQIEIKVNGVLVSSNSIFGGPVVGTSYPSGGIAGAYPFIPTTVTPTNYNFSVPGINSGDVITMRLKYDTASSPSTATIVVMQAGYLNVNPLALGVSKWQYNFSTNQMQNINGDTVDAVWQPMYSSIAMTGLEIQLGSTVNFQFYDKFRSYNALDMLSGIIQMFNLSVQTDSISRIVTIEPTNDYTLPDGTVMPGYFVPERLDWTLKQDLNKENEVQLFSGVERQFDFQFKQDGSDGGQNIFTARYKNIYLNNKTSTVFNNLNNTNNENGIVAAVPGASRYIFPNRFQKGARQMTNSFFSATMHYNHAPWSNITTILSGGTAPAIAPQLIAIIPENINDSSASAVTQTFEPKIAFYSGQEAINAVGGWRWIGDPAAPYADGGSPNAIGFNLPYMFAVDYSGAVANVPTLTYSDQNIGGAIVAGLMKTYYLKRLATMRVGKQYRPWMRLTLGDMIDWTHRNTLIINGSLYYLIAIDSFDPLSDKSTQCTLWKATNPEQVDLDNTFPSTVSILTSPTMLAQFDLKYAKLLLYMSDIPQAG